MYDVTITTGGITQTIHNFRTALRSEKLPKGVIADKENSISSFTFEIYPNNSGYDALSEYATKVMVYNNQKNRYDFVGRVLQINPEMDADGLVYKEVICEDRKGYLQDSIQPYTAERQYEGDEERNGLEEFIDVLLANHNAQVEDEKKIYRGNVTVTTYASSEGVFKGLNYETTWECIKKKLIDSFGGQIQLRENNGALYLDYADALGQTRATTIELGKNMKKISREVDPSEIITRLIPLGSKISIIETDEEGNETETETDERLTVAAANGGLNYIQDDIAYAKYGGIYDTREWDDVTVAANLLAKGQEYLQEHNYVIEGIKLDAVDLSLLGIDIDDFRLYDAYPVKNKLIGMDDTFTIIKKTTDIIEPQRSSFEMGDVSKSLMADMTDIDTAIKAVESKVSKVSTVATNQNNSLYSYLMQTASAINQTANEISLSVESIKTSITDYETFETIVKTQLQLDDSGAALVFDTINNYIRQVNDTSVSNYNEILKYIRFIDGDIILGNTESPFSLKIENDRIAFYYNSMALGRFEPNKLFIPEQIEIPVGGSLRMGNYAFIPRSNGNLSFKYVGGDS